VSEQRYRAVLEVQAGVSVTEVAERYGVSRQSVHAWLRRYGVEGSVRSCGSLAPAGWAPVAVGCEGGGGDLRAAPGASPVGAPPAGVRDGPARPGVGVAVDGVSNVAAQRADRTALTEAAAGSVSTVGAGGGDGAVAAGRDRQRSSWHDSPDTANGHSQREAAAPSPRSPKSKPAASLTTTPSSGSTGSTPTKKKRSCLLALGQASNSSSRQSGQRRPPPR
jgi:hypothetical protein